MTFNTPLVIFEMEAYFLPVVTSSVDGGGFFCLLIKCGVSGKVFGFNH